MSVVELPPYVPQPKVSEGVTEFIALSLWDGIDAIRAFAGEDIEAAVLYAEDERYLVDGESRTTHYDIVDQIPSP